MSKWEQKKTTTKIHHRVFVIVSPEITGYNVTWYYVYRTAKYRFPSLKMRYTPLKIPARIQHIIYWNKLTA